MNNIDYFIYYATGKNSISFIRSQIQLLDIRLIYLNSMFSENFSIKILVDLFLYDFQGKILLSPRGMLKDSALEKSRLKKYFYLKCAKVMGLYKNVLFHATNDVEKDEIKKVFPKAAVFIVDNLAPAVTTQIDSNDKEVGTINLVFVGRVHPIKNLLFLIDLLKEVNSNIEIIVIGNVEDERYYKGLIHKTKEYPSNITVSFKGALEHKEISSALNESHLFVLPTLGENYGHAIIEALSVGRPVLISDQTPWKNLKEYNAGWELPLSDKQAWIKAIEEAASWDQAEFDKHCEGALAYAKAHSNNEELVKKYVEMFGGRETTEGTKEH